MSRSTTRRFAGTVGTAALVAAAGIATGSAAHASTALENQSCTITYSGAGAPAAQTFTTGVQWAYDEHGDVTGTPATVHSVNESVQIGFPDDVVSTFAKLGLNQAGATGSEWFTVNGAPAQPFDLSVPAFNNIHGVMDVQAAGEATDVAVPAGVDTSSPVAFKHTGTTLTWKANGVTATLQCGTGAAPVQPTNPPTTTPTAPPTTGTTTTPSKPCPPHHGHHHHHPGKPCPTSKPTNPGMPSQPTKPVTPVTPVTPGQGPKVQTDNVSSISSTGEFVGLGSAIALGGVGTTLVARRRKQK